MAAKNTSSVLIGTGTGVGKTHAAVSLLHAARARGLVAAGLKPVESGVAHGPSDFSRLAQASAVPVSQPPYALPDAVSPHLAAERAGTAIALPTIVEWVRHHRADLIIVETAGGLLSPLSLATTNVDLLKALSPSRVVLIAPDRLGVLHEVCACIIALRYLAPELPAPLLALQSVAAPDLSTGTNAAELERLGLVPAAATFPWAAANDPATAVAAAALLDRILPAPK